MSKNIYLDANGGIEMCHDAIEKYKMASELTNPSNITSSAGRVAATIYESALDFIRTSVGSVQDKILVTSSATESNATILYNIHKNYPCGHILIVQDAHPSIEEAAKQYKIDYAFCSPDAFESAITDMTIAVVITHVSSLTGKIQPSAKMIRRIHSIDPKIMVLCDATQAVGRLRINRSNIGADYMTFSSHKFGGPKGIGFILISNKAYKREDMTWHSLIPGGQQNNMRGGTHNVSGVVSSAAALRYKLDTLYNDRRNTISMTRGLYRSLCELDNVSILNVQSEDEIEHTLGNTLLLKVPVCSKAIAVRLSEFGYDVGIGCACQTEKTTSPNVLRISLPMGITEPLDEFAPMLSSIINELGTSDETIQDPSPVSTKPDLSILMPDTKLTDEQAIWAAEQLNVNLDSVLPDGLKTWMYGINVEREHGPKPHGWDNTDVGDVDLLIYAKITLAHLMEFPDYYDRLHKMEEAAEKYWKDKTKPKILQE
mgnify:CR=1 FL=1